MARLPAVESRALRRSLSDRFTRGAEADAQAWSCRREAIIGKSARKGGADRRGLSAEHSTQSTA